MVKEVGMEKSEHTNDPIGALVRARREQVQMSVRALAKASGFSASFISQVEHGQASPSIASLEKMASVLGLTLSEFFARKGDERPGPVVVRADQRPELTSWWSQATVEVLGAPHAMNQIDPIMITLAPGGRSSARPARHQGEEFAMVFAGKILLTLEDTHYEMTRGDSVSFAPETPHQWTNTSGNDAQLIIVSVKPRA